MLTNRPPASGPGVMPTIPEKEIRAYAWAHGLELDILKRIMWGVDQVWLKHHREKWEAEQEAKRRT